jgi:GT2 family glycosyltransferase
VSAIADITSVVIVNFNAGAYLVAAVASALAQNQAVEIIVVDNNSNDDSIARLRDRFSDAEACVVQLDTNYGFAHACNIGIARAHGAALLLLNPDCRMAPGSLGRLKTVLESRPDLGMVGPLLVNPDGSEQRGGRRDIPSPWQILCMTLQFHRLMPNHPRFRSINLLGQPLPARPIKVQAISGACMLVKRAVAEKVGNLDSDYFLHFEDLDWCLRFANAGFGILFVPQAVVEHTQGVCGRARPRRVAYHKHRSLLIFMRKNFTQFYPSSFMALVSFAITLRFAVIAILSLFVARPVYRDPWERMARWHDPSQGDLNSRTEDDS